MTESTTAKPKRIRQISTEMMLKAVKRLTEQIDQRREQRHELLVKLGETENRIGQVTKSLLKTDET